MALVDELMTGSATPLADNDPTLPALSVSDGGDPTRPKPKPAVQGATFVAAKRDPARWAKVTNLASRWNLQPDFVDRNFDTLSRVDTERAQTRQATDVSPTLANWLTDPDNATIATHDVAHLSRVDAGVKAIAPQTQGEDGGAVGTALATGAADLASSAGHLAAAWGLTSPQQAARFVADMNLRAKTLRDQAPDYAKEFSAAQQEHAGDVDRAVRATLGGQAVYRRNDIIGALANYLDPAQQIGHAAHTLGEVLGIIGAAARRPRGAAYAGIEGLASMAPMLGGSMAGGAVGAALGSVVPGVGTAIGGTVGGMVGTFAGMAPVNVGAEINAELTKRGVDITDQAALERAFSDPSLMASVRSKAEKAGITNALVVSLFSGFAGKLAAGAADAGKVAKVGAHAADVGIQSAGMGVAQMAGQAASGEQVSPGAALSTAIQTLGVSAGMEAVGASRRSAFHADPVEAAVDVAKQADSALRAHQDAQSLAEIGEAVKGAATTSQVPDRIKSLVETATGGQDAAHVFFQADDWNAYWSSRGASPAKMAGDIMGDGGKAYYESQTTGAPLAVPLGDYVSRVAPTEHWDGLLAAARTTPDGMSLSEAAEYIKSLPATMQEIATEAARNESESRKNSDGSEKNAGQNPDSAAQVGDRVRSQLAKAGLSESAARAQASLYESTFRSLGKRAGQDPAALFDQYNLSIKRGRATDAITKAAEAARAAEAHITALAEGDPDHAAKLARPRTESGRLKNLTKATDDELVNEYATLIDTNAAEMVAPTIVEDEHLLNNEGRPHVSMKPAAMKAAGRVAQRGKSIAKIEAELTRRGIEHADAYTRGYENARNIDPTEFAFGANAFGQSTLDEFDTPEIRVLREKAAAIPSPEDTPKRRAENVRKARALAKATKFERRADVVLGLPGSGKTSVVGRALVEEHGGANLDADILAQQAPEYENGLGVKALLPESSATREAAFRLAMRDGANFLYPTIGSAWTPDVIRTMQEHGYEVHVHLVDVPAEEAARRSTAGYVKGGRHFVDPRDTFQMGDAPRRAFAAIADLPGVILHDPYDNAVPEGTPPRRVEHWRDEWDLHGRGAARDGAAQAAEPGRSPRGEVAGGRAPQGPADEGVAGDPLAQSSRRDNNKPRGQIVFGEHGVSIDLLEKADRSTFLHETGHFYLKILGDLAESLSAAPEIKADYTTIRGWLGAEDGAELTRAQHEQFARGFEAYLMEGKAPSSSLRGVFYRFREWLVGVYKQVGALNVTLTPEVRRVFDRLIASDDEITQAERESTAQPLFDDPKAVGLNDVQAATYQKAVADAHQAAVEELTTRLMKDIRREESKEWAAFRKPIEAQVTTEIDESPAYRALEFLRKGTNPDGSALPDDVTPLKLSRAEVVDMIGKDAAATLPKEIYGADGVSPELIAELFGFESGRDLVDALVGTPPRKQAIRALTEQRLQVQHGERMSDADVHQAATEALHNDKRAQLLRKELEILASQDLPALKGLVRAVTKKVPPSAEVKAQAARIIGEKAVRDIRPDLFEKAATKAGRDAREALLKGDVDAAFEAKRKELLATEVAQSAATARQQIEGALDTFRKVFRNDKALADTRDMDLVNAARSVLASFGIGRSDKAPSEYLAQIREYDPEGAAIVQALVDEATQSAGGGKDYKSLTMDEFTTLRDAVHGLWTLARSTRQILVDGQRMDRLQVQAELGARIDALKGSSDMPGARQAVGALGEMKSALLSLRAVSRKIEHWVRAMDAGENGIFRRYLWNRVSEAATAFRVEKTKAVTEYATHLASLADRDMPLTRAKIPAPELGYTFAGHNELLGALLHVGNESNLAKNLVGRRWATVLEDGSIDTSRWDAFTSRMRREGVLTKAHYDWAQDVWNRMDALKPGAQAAHRAIYGRYFAEITSTPFENEYGTYRGGYYPAKADQTIVSDALARSDADALLGSNTSFMFPGPGKGFTMKRVEAYRKPLVMDASAVPQHMDAVLRFTHLGPAVREVARVVMSPDFRERLNGLDPAMVHDALVPWLQRAAQQRGEMPSEGGRFWRYMNSTARAIRNNASLQIMSGNTTVLLEQLTHFPSVFVRVDKGAFASAAWSYATGRKAMVESIHEASPFMATRESAGLDVARKALDKILLDPSVFDSVRTYGESHGRFLMSAVQSAMDHSVWSAAYDTAMETMSHAEAVRHADASVRELLGSYAPEDISRIEAGTPVQRLFTMFLGFFNTKANVLGTEFSIAKELGFGQSKARAAGALLWGFAVPAMMGLAIKNVVAGKGPLDATDDEGTLHALLALFGQSSLEMGARMIPYGGGALTIAEHALEKGKREDLLNSPAMKMLSDGIGAPFRLAHGIHTNAVSPKQISDIFSTAGLVFGLPMRPIGRAAGYAYDVYAGNARPTNVVEAVHGAMTGKAGAP